VSGDADGNGTVVHVDPEPNAPHEPHEPVILRQQKWRPGPGQPPASLRPSSGHHPVQSLFNHRVTTVQSRFNHNAATTVATRTWPATKVATRTRQHKWRPGPSNKRGDPYLATTVATRTVYHDYDDDDDDVDGCDADDADDDVDAGDDADNDKTTQCSLA
jgi:hypothetical protein